MKFHLESLEDRCCPSGIAVPQVEMVYLSSQNAGSMDAALGYLAAQNGGQVVSSVVFPSWASAWGPNIALDLGLLTGAVPYQGTSTILVVVVPPGVSFDPYHELLPFFGGQIPVEVIPGDSPGHPEFPGASFDFSAIVNGYFATDPPAPYFAAPEPVPGIDTVTVDYVTGLPPPGPDSQGQLRAPDIQAADALFSWWLAHSL